MFVLLFVLPSLTYNWVTADEPTCPDEVPVGGTKPVDNVHPGTPALTDGPTTAQPKKFEIYGAGLTHLLLESLCMEPKSATIFISPVYEAWIPGMPRMSSVHHRSFLWNGKRPVRSRSAHMDDILRRGHAQLGVAFRDIDACYFALYILLTTVTNTTIIGF